MTADPMPNAINATPASPTQSQPTQALAMHTGRQAFVVHPTKSSQADTLLRDQMRMLLAALQIDYPQLEIEEPQVLGMFEGDGVTVRVVNQCDEGLFAIEVIDLVRRDRWHAYYVRLPDESFRTGWQRSCEGDIWEPAQWLEAVTHLVIGEEIEPHRNPDFIALVGAMSSASPITYAQSDAQQVRELQEEVELLRLQTTLQAAKLRALSTAQPKAVQAAAPDQAPRQWRLDEMGEWAADNADRITILPRAISAAKKSLYEQPELVYAALELLASTYRSVKLGQQDRNDLLDGARDLGLEIGGSIDPVRITNDYLVRWGRGKRVLDQHLSRGVSRDTRLCLRIYYFWCEDTQRAVVGWLPSHLDNRMT